MTTEINLWATYDPGQLFLVKCVYPLSIHNQHMYVIERCNLQQKDIFCLTQMFLQYWKGSEHFFGKILFKEKLLTAKLDNFFLEEKIIVPL